PLLHPPTPPLFPYTTLFRSRHTAIHDHGGTMTDCIWIAEVKPLGERMELTCSVCGQAQVFATADPAGCHKNCSAATGAPRPSTPDRKSTRLNSSHVAISYAV